MQDLLQGLRDLIQWDVELLADMRVRIHARFSLLHIVNIIGTRDSLLAHINGDHGGGDSTVHRSLRINDNPLHIS